MKLQRRINYSFLEMKKTYNTKKEISLSYDSPLLDSGRKNVMASKRIVIKITINGIYY